jgi:hypothetical protein
MSIWVSRDEIGWDTFPRRHTNIGGDVRSYATGWSNHYPTVNGKVERRASIELASIPSYCVPGHRDDDDWSGSGPWLRLGVDGWRHDYHNSTEATSDSLAVVLDAGAVTALVAGLQSWLNEPKVNPIKHKPKTKQARQENR